MVWYRKESTTDYRHLTTTATLWANMFGISRKCYATKGIEIATFANFFTHSAHTIIINAGTMYDFHNFGLIFMGQCTVCLKG